MSALVLRGNRATSLNTDGSASAELTLRVDNSVRPRRIDLVRTGKRRGPSLIGVYEVRDDKLQWYYTWDGARPTKLSRLPDGLWLTLKRVKGKD